MRAAPDNQWGVDGELGLCFAAVAGTDLHFRWQGSKRAGSC